MNAGPVLQAAGLSAAYPDGHEAVCCVDLSVSRGEILGITGPSGCGKTTLCLCLAGIIPHSSPAEMRGEVLIDGRSTRGLSLPEIATRVGMVFQDPVTQLFLPSLRNELAFGPENLCREPAGILRTVRDVAGLAGIAEILDAHPHRISGGQQQLAAIAAVLAMEPDVLILDEAMSQLDAESARKIREVALALRERGCAVVMIDHSLRRLEIADRVVLMESGRIIIDGRADAVLKGVQAREGMG